MVGTSTTNDLLASHLASTPDFASNISAVLRRMLPAIRILSKWLGSRLDYIGRVEARVIAREHQVPKLQGTESSGIDSTGEGREDVRHQSGGIRIKSEELSKVLCQFWTAHATFSNTNLRAFPASSIADCDETVWLEEDVDMLGFAPLKKGMKEGKESLEGGIQRVGKDVHPNEEQMMRIREIQKDSISVSANRVSCSLRLFTRASITH